MKAFATAIEYELIAARIAVVIIGGISLAGGALTNTLILLSPRCSVSGPLQEKLTARATIIATGLSHNIPRFSFNVPVRHAAEDALKASPKASETEKHAKSAKADVKKNQ